MVKMINFMYILPPPPPPKKKSLHVEFVPLQAKLNFNQKTQDCLPFGNGSKQHQPSRGSQFVELRPKKSVRIELNEYMDKACDNGDIWQMEHCAFYQDLQRLSEHQAARRRVLLSQTGGVWGPLLLCLILSTSFFPPNRISD